MIESAWIGKSRYDGSGCRIRIWFGISMLKLHVSSGACGGDISWRVCCIGTLKSQLRILFIELGSE